MECEAGTGIIIQVLNELLADITPGEGKSLSDQQLLSLHCLFPQQLQVALELVEQEAVTLYTCSTPAFTRSLWMVQGSTGNKYTILAPSPSPANYPSPSSGYCSCLSYVYSVLVRGETALCKHQLATLLATVLGRCQVQQLSPQQWAHTASADTNT